MCINVLRTYLSILIIVLFVFKYRCILLRQTFKLFFSIQVFVWNMGRGTIFSHLWAPLINANLMSQSSNSLQDDISQPQHICHSREPYLYLFATNQDMTVLLMLHPMRFPFIQGLKTKIIYGHTGFTAPFWKCIYQHAWKQKSCGNWRTL